MMRFPPLISPSRPFGPSFVLALGLVWLAAPPASHARDVKVRIVTAKTVRERTVDWDVKAAGLLESASKVFEAQFGVRFVNTDSVEWIPDPGLADMNSLYNDLDNTTSRKGADLILGFARVPEKTGANVSGLVKSRDCALINVPSWNEKKIGRVLLHELGHVFGATHLTDPADIMNPQYLKQTEEAKFGGTNVEIVRLFAEKPLKDATWDLDDRSRARYRDLLDRVSVDAPADYSFEVERGILHLVAGNGSLDGAEAAFEKAARIDPTSDLAWNYLGRTRLLKGEPEKALEAFVKAVNAAPNSAYAHFGLGESLLILNRPGEALDGFERAAALDAEASDAHFGAAESLRKLGRNAEAAARYDRASAGFSRLRDLAYGKGLALLAADRFPEAAAAFGRALELGGDSPELWIALAKAAFGAGDDALTRKALTATLLDRPGSEEARVLQARLENRSGAPDKARAILTEIEDRPSDDPLNRALRLAEAWLELGEIQRAVRWYEIAGETAPDSAPARIGLGIAYDLKGWTARALREYQTAILIDPYLPEAYERFLESCRINGQPGLGREALDQAVRLKIGVPDHLTAPFGGLRSQTGNPADGRKPGEAK